MNATGQLTRRQLWQALTGALLSACRDVTSPGGTSSAHLSARPHAVATTIEPGERRVGPSGRGAILYVAASAISAQRPVPFMVMLHGASQSAEAMRFTFAHAERIGAIVLAPDSRGTTWDMLTGGFGPDVAFINGTLEETFARVQVDTAHVTIGGFSDGASYALSLGLPNGTLFTHVIAFSPGFNAAPSREGRPRIFISHGTGDKVLPIDQTSRRIVSQLQRARYDVTYVEFDGRHTVPDTIAREAFDWSAKDQRR